MKAAERERVRHTKASQRAYNSELKEREREAKARERQLKQTAVANAKERAAQEKAVKAAHISAQTTEVEGLNAQISDLHDELDGLLAATLDVDDFVDLEALRKPDDAPFDKPELETPLVAPTKPTIPTEPVYVQPPKPGGLFGKKKKLERAKQVAQSGFENKHRNWKDRVSRLEAEYQADLATYNAAEKQRVELLALETERFNDERLEHNRTIDQFISNLGYGDRDAVQDYIALVVENSRYPDHFSVEHDFSFVPTDAELRMKVSILPPKEFPDVKAYKYVKASDEIRSTTLPKAELKKRYCSALYQVAVRSLHEVFEADRRSIIRTIALEVGTKDADPATGKRGFIPFVAVSAEKTSFMEYDLSNVVPLATLQHLSASLSKDPMALMAADVTGVRQS
jgi:restriction system protein